MREAGSSGTLIDNLYKLRLVDVASSTGSTRDLQVIAVSNGNLKKVSSGSGTPASPAGTNTLSQPELDSTSQFLQGVEAFGKFFMVDGVNTLYYDAATDEVLEWTSTTAGRVPPRCKLVTAWRGRLVLARDPDNAHTWHMSEAGDPFGWDTLPIVITQTQAISGTTAGSPGDVDDIINAVIPYSFDFLVFGCDHKIFMMRGDPAA